MIALDDVMVVADEGAGCGVRGVEFRKVNGLVSFVVDEVFRRSGRNRLI